MPFIFKRKSGIYYYRKTYNLPSGKRQQIHCSLKTSDPIFAQCLALKVYLNISADGEIEKAANSNRRHEVSGRDGDAVFSCKCGISGLLKSSRTASSINV